MAGADVSVGYKGGLNTTWQPITEPYYQKGLCPVNVHWHLGAEHRSEGEYDETFADKGPDGTHRHLAEDARLGLRCKHYDASDPKFTTEYDWQHCIGMHVGETYEVHWPHSAVGACGTPNQYQTPFYDGVFCNLSAEAFSGLTAENIKDAVGVQGQVFTIVSLILCVHQCVSCSFDKFWECSRPVLSKYRLMMNPTITLISCEE